MLKINLLKSCVKVLELSMCKSFICRFLSSASVNTLLKVVWDALVKAQV